VFRFELVWLCSRWVPELAQLCERGTDGEGKFWQPSHSKREGASFLLQTEPLTVGIQLMQPTFSPIGSTKRR
jgi:hypothetical protein